MKAKGTANTFPVFHLSHCLVCGRSYPQRLRLWVEVSLMLREEDHALFPEQWPSEEAQERRLQGYSWPRFAWLRW